MRESLPAVLEGPLLPKADMIDISVVVSLDRCRWSVRSAHACVPSELTHSALAQGIWILCNRPLRIGIGLRRLGEFPKYCAAWKAS